MKLSNVLCSFQIDFSAKLKLQDLRNDSFRLVKKTVNVDPMENSAVSVRVDNDGSGVEDDDDGAEVGILRDLLSLPRRVDRSARFFYDVSMLVSLMTDRFANRICCVRTIQYQ